MVPGRRHADVRHGHGAAGRDLEVPEVRRPRAHLGDRRRHFGHVRAALPPAVEHRHPSDHSGASCACKHERTMNKNDLLCAGTTSTPT